MDTTLIIDKPQGMTSHDVVDFVRKKFKIRKVGHCGTLDPMATGVLVILLGKATKLSAKLSGSDKEYVCTLRLGMTTDSQDATGKPIDRSSIEGITIDQVEKVIYSFKGQQQQIPPMVSAKYHNGKRLYKLARKGIEVERDPQSIDVKEIEIIKVAMPEIMLRVACSKGTYIRTICHDIGQRLGCGGHMSALRRISSGSFHIKDAVSLDVIAREPFDKLRINSVTEAIQTNENNIRTE